MFYMYANLFVLIYLKFNALYFLTFSMNLIQFLKFLKFFNTRKYTINNDVLIKIHYYTKYIKIKNFTQNLIHDK